MGKVPSFVSASTQETLLHSGAEETDELIYRITFASELGEHQLRVG